MMIGNTHRAPSVSEGVQHVEAETGIASLVRGIMHDAQILVGQQFTMFRREIVETAHQAMTAVICMAIGAGAVAIAAFLLMMMVVHVLNTFAGLPLWSCYALMGGLLAVVGALLLYLGGKRISDTHLFKPPKTTEAIEENLRWLKNQTSSHHA
jgi:hypothetical protein